VTLWVLSTDNLGRPIEERRHSCGRGGQARGARGRSANSRQRVRIRAIGQLELLPERTLDAIRAAQEATATYDAWCSQSPSPTVARRDRRCGRALLTAQRERGAFWPRSSSSSMPTLSAVISIWPACRSGSDHPHQRRGAAVGLPALAERLQRVLFSDVYWPAFRRIDLLRAIRAFQQRGRRFGS